MARFSRALSSRADDLFSFSAADMNAETSSIGSDWLSTSHVESGKQLMGTLPRLYSTYAGGAAFRAKQWCGGRGIQNDGKLDTATVNYVSNISAAMTILVQGSAVSTLGMPVLGSSAREGNCSADDHIDER